MSYTTMQITLCRGITHLREADGSTSEDPAAKNVASADDLIRPTNYVENLLTADADNWGASARWTDEDDEINGKGGQDILVTGGGDDKIIIDFVDYMVGQNAGSVILDWTDKGTATDNKGDVIEIQNKGVKIASADIVATAATSFDKDTHKGYYYEVDMGTAYGLGNTARVTFIQDVDNNGIWDSTIDKSISVIFYQLQGFTTANSHLFATAAALNFNNDDIIA